MLFTVEQALVDTVTSKWKRTSTKKDLKRTIYEWNEGLIVQLLSMK